MWLIYALLSAVSAALVAILSKIGLKEVDSILATTIRSIIMMIFLVLTAFLLGKFKGFSFDTLENKAWLMIVLASICGALSWLFYFLALKYGLASKVIAIDRLSLVLVVFLAVVLLKEPLGWKLAVGAFLMTGGAILIAL